MIFYILIAVLFTSSAYANANEDDKLLRIKEWVNQGNALPFKPAVPNDFVMKSRLPDGNIGLGEGVIWARNETIEEVWGQYKGNPETVFTSQAGLIRAHLSHNGAQDKSGAFDIGKKKLEKELKKMGAKNVRFRDVKWGDYPVSALEATFDNRKPVAMAWMGLNAGGPIVFIDYIFPDNQLSYEKDWKIWNQFLSETKGIPLEVVMKSMEDFVNSLSQETKLELKETSFLVK